MKHLIAAVAALLACACGGGGYMPPAPTQARADLFFGYYLTDDGVTQVSDHVNIVHESGDDLSKAIADMRLGRKPTILGVLGQTYRPAVPGSAVRVPNEDLETALAYTFDTLRAAGVLSQVVALYPIDEPDINGPDNDQVTSVNERTRAVMARYPELENCKLAVTYTSKGSLPGFASYDWIGMDDYGLGSDVLVSDAWKQILARLAPAQRVFVVPGGASPWMQDPEAFIRYAESTPQCVGILAFIWSDWEGHPGIASNGMATTYRAAGRRVIGAVS